jgi:hypothetical protein
MDYAEFVAIGLRDRNDVRLMTPSFERLWPVDPAPCFDALLRAIDKADWRQAANRHRAGA